ncbi:MAG TPA: hypothetical protein PLV21_15340 [Cyclobacteriaceae bacterium]|mgnify:CR=1 FL=1|nr:hypothetical protein [Cyclobacteriaceae bacterium]HRJ83261.1 hypothetical protein [Cyclobacteriaceae bacterium]
MEAIRRKKVKRIGKKIIIELPDSFKANEVDLIIWPSQEEKTENKVDTKLWKKNLTKFYADFNINVSKFKFNREELYDR